MERGSLAGLEIFDTDRVAIAGSGDLSGAGQCELHKVVRAGQRRPSASTILEVKVAHSAMDWRRAEEAHGRKHGLGAGSEAGDRLCQLVMEEGKLVAGLVWCAAAWHLKVRDEAVGWDAVTRSEFCIRTLPEQGKISRG